jgi:hypothetical protein
VIRLKGLEYRPHLQYTIENHEPVSFFESMEQNATYSNTVATPSELWSIIKEINERLLQILDIIDKRLKDIQFKCGIDPETLAEIKSTYNDNSKEGYVSYETYKKAVANISDPVNKAIFDSVNSNNNHLGGYTELGRYNICSDIQNESNNLLNFIKDTCFYLIDKTYSSKVPDSVFTDDILKKLEVVEKGYYDAVVSAEEDYLSSINDAFEEDTDMSRASAIYHDMSFKYDKLKTLEDSKRISVSKALVLRNELNGVYENIQKTKTEQFDSKPAEIVYNLISNRKQITEIDKIPVMLESLYNKKATDGLKEMNQIYASTGNNIRDKLKDQVTLHCKYRNNVMSDTVRWLSETGGPPQDSDNSSTVTVTNKAFDEIANIISEAANLVDNNYSSFMVDYDKITRLSNKHRNNYEMMLREQDKINSLNSTIDMIKTKTVSTQKISDMENWAKTVSEII